MDSSERGDDVSPLGVGILQLLSHDCSTGEWALVLTVVITLAHAVHCTRVDRDLHVRIIHRISSVTNRHLVRRRCWRSIGDNP